MWFTLKDSGKVEVFNARPPFQVLRIIESGPITNHVSFGRNSRGTFAYVTIGGLNQVRVYRLTDFKLCATIATGDLPHGIWPAGDGSRVYVGLEGGDGISAIDTLTNSIIATVPIGQAPQAVNYVPGAMPDDAVVSQLPPPRLGLAGGRERLTLVARSDAGSSTAKPATIVSLYDQGLTQVLEAAVTGLVPGEPYIIALSERPDGSGQLQPLSAFVTNPAGAAIVNAVGPIRQIVRARNAAQRRYFVVAPGTSTQFGAPVQIQTQ